LTSIVLVILFVGVGCTSRGSEAPVAPSAGWPEALSDFTVDWTADPGIDLTVGPAVVVRAYMESYYLAYLTDDEKYFYPGFQQAVNPNEPDGPDGTEALWPSPSGPETWVGTVRQHLLRIDRSGRDVAAVGCVYTYDSGGLVGGKFKANIGGMGPYGGISTFRIELQAPQDGEEALPAQRGPSRAPFENVFGGWRVTNHQGGYLLLAHWAGEGNDKQECLSRSEGTPESRKFVFGTTYLRSDFSTLPATPGWPAKPGN
jgi:hypothetical protein